MAILYTHDYSPDETIVASDVDGPFGMHEITGIPFDTFPAGPLRITISGEARYDDNGGGGAAAEIVFLLADPGADHHFALPGEIWGDGLSLTATYVARTAGGDPDGDFTHDGNAKTIYIHSPLNNVTFNEQQARIRNYTITVESMGPTPAAAEIESPAAGDIDTGPELVFTATSGADLTAVIATVTDAGGVPTVAYGLDGFVDPYFGAVESLADGIRVRLRRRGWPLGPLKLDVHVEDNA